MIHPSLVLPSQLESCHDVQPTHRRRSRRSRGRRVSNLEEFFVPVPKYPLPELRLPPRLTEMEALDQLGLLASRNAAFPAEDTYLGAGAYGHFIPPPSVKFSLAASSIRPIHLINPKSLRARSRSYMSFQSLVASLTGMDVANASMYDGATALAEGALMTVSLPRGRRRIVVASTYIQAIGAC